MDGEPRSRDTEGRSDGKTDTEPSHVASPKDRRGLLKRAGAALCAGVGVSGNLGGSRSRQTRDGSSSENEGISPPNSDHSLLFWNTWLLDGIMGISAKPGYEERADEIGQVLERVGYDIVALCEVFDADEREAVESGFPVGEEGVESRVGPEGGCLEVSSGLYTLLAGDGSERQPRFVSSDKVVYEEDGQEVRDADALARKGVLHTEIDVGPGNVDLFSTHLLAGGGLGFVETLFGWLSPDVPDREQREAQVEELVDFVERKAKDENVTVVAGDFNIHAGSEEHEATIGSMTDELDLYDAWLRHAEGAGATDTAGLTAGCDIDEDGGEPYRCQNDDPDRQGGARIDYIFVEEPKPAHRFELDVAGIDRATFWRGKGNQERFYADGNRQKPNYLSDHAGLELHFDAVSK